ncbi:uncharacterized protein METZ01_LOCUS307380, partial [marine metagenome]
YGWPLNSATDVLLKKDFDAYRQRQEPHPFLLKKGFGHLIPLQHEDFQRWTVATQLGLHTVHEQTNLKVGGGLDDVWLNTKTNQIHVVDYKSTSSGKEGNVISLDDRPYIKIQIEFYQWVLLQNGFDVSPTGYVLYVDGDRFTPGGMLGEDDATMQFKVSLLDFAGNTDWIEPVLFKIREMLDTLTCPDHEFSCPYGEYLDKSFALRVDA